MFENYLLTGAVRLFISSRLFHFFLRFISSNSLLRALRIVTVLQRLW